MNNGLKDRDLQTLLGIFRKYPEVHNVYLFGSRAMQRYHTGSDIDLAVMDNAISDKTIRAIKADFEESDLPYFVDLKKVNSIENPQLKEHIQRVGVPFYIHN